MKSIKNVLVVGAGMMGKNIAFVLTANPSISVVMTDIAEQDVYAGIRTNCRQLVEHEVISTEEIEDRLKRIVFTTDMTCVLVKNADLVIEAVFEDMSIKRETFAKLETVCSTDAIFCTNTSVMRPSEISAELKYRSRFVGTHFWNPAHLMPLVEVVKSDATSDDTAEAVMTLLKSVGKKPILCKKDVPGFVANRLQHALWREAFYMVENGIADAATVDDACKYGPGLRWPVLGPMENSDMVGIGLSYNIHNYILNALADNHEPSKCLKEMLDRGDLGFTTGKGWQEWTPEEINASGTELTEYLIDVAAKKEK